MNRFQTKKLLLSKWTARNPVDKQKHFIVVACLEDEITQKITHCTLEAVMTKTQFTVSPNALKNADEWQMGWR